MPRSREVVAARRLEPWLGREMASLEQAERIGLPLGPTFVEERHPSRILTTRSEPGQRLGELYLEMLEKDADLAAFVDKRIELVTSLPRTIVPADSSPLAREVADFVRAALSRIPSFGDNLEHQLRAIPFGLALDEVIWEQVSRGPLAGSWLPVDLIDRPLWRFAFRRGERGSIYVRRPGHAEPLLAPPRKLLAMRGGTKDSPWGRALLDKCYWYWFIKKHGWKYWSVFIEKWSSPTALGKYRHGPDERQNQESQERLLAAIEAIQTEYGLVIPSGLDIDLLEATRSGSVSYEHFLEACTRGEARVLLGEVDTSGAGKGPGSFAKAEVANLSRSEKGKTDAHRLESHVSDTLIRWIVDLNFGPEAPAPKLWIAAIDAEDRDLRLRGIDKVLELGEAVPRAYFYMTAQVPEPREGEETVTKRQSAPAEPPLLQPVPTPAAADARAHSEASVQLAAQGLKDLGARLAERSRALEEVVEAFLPSTLDYFSVQRERVLALWDAGAAAEGNLLRRLVEGLAPGAHAERLETAQIHGMGRALLDLQEDLGLGTLRLAAPGDFAGSKTPETAIEFWAGLLNIPKEIFRELQDANRRFAFMVAGVTDAALLADLHQLVGRSLAEGLDRRIFVRELDALYRKHGVTPTAKAHAELIYTNNVRQANGVIRYRQTVGNPQVHALIPYLFWWDLADERVRQRPLHDHAVMHGYVAAIGHEIWQTWWYPAGHACRCSIGTVNRAEARRRGLTGAEPVGPWPIAPGTGTRALPDPGFRGAPNLETLSLDVEDRARAVLAEAERTGARDLLAALQQLFAVLGIARQLFGLADLLARRSA